MFCGICAAVGSNGGGGRIIGLSYLTAISSTVRHAQHRSSDLLGIDNWEIELWQVDIKVKLV